MLILITRHHVFFFLFPSFQATMGDLYADNCGDAISTVLKKLETDQNGGLTTAQVGELQAKYGKNELEQEEGKLRESIFEKIHTLHLIFFSVPFF